MLTVFIASIALYFLPVIVHSFRGSKGVAQVADAFVLSSVLGIILITLIPELLSHEHFMGIVAFLLGLVIPVAIERLMAKASMVAVTVVIPVFILHSVLDGAALVAVSNDGLAAAILLHRLPVGLLIYLVASHRWNPRFGFGLLTVFAIATLGGGMFGDGIIKAVLGDSCPFLVEAFLGGALMHVVFHVVPYDMIVKGHSSDGISKEGTKNHCHKEKEKETSCHSEHDRSHEHCGNEIRRPEFPEPSTFKGWADCLGIVLAAVAVWLIGYVVKDGGAPETAEVHGHGGHGEFPVVESFMEFALESSVALLIAYVLGGLLHEFFPKSALSWLQKGKTLTQSFKGVAFGLPLPICSCGVLPLYESLTRRGVPAAAGTAFLVATPELGLDAILLSLPLLGEEFTLVRVGAAFVLAMLAGVLLSAVMKKHEPGCSMATTADDESRLPFKLRLKSAFIYGAVDLVDNTMPWVLVGLAIASICAPALSPEFFGALDPNLQVPLFALIGIPVYVCASGATPIAAIALIKGVSPGAVLAFLLTGPATNATTFGVLSNLHSKRSAVAFGVTIGAFSILLGYAVNLFFGETSPVSSGEHHEESLIQWGAMFVLIALIGYGGLRKGLRGFFAKLVNSH